MVEIKKKNFFYEIVENKNETNLKLGDLKAPLNPFKPIYSAVPHEHIHPQHYLKNAEHELHDKHKYLAYFDIIVDNHLRQVRPNMIYDDKLAYVKPLNRPTRYSETRVMDNMYFDYLYSMDNELFKKLKKEFQEFNHPNLIPTKDTHVDHHNDHSASADHGHHGHDNGLGHGHEKCVVDDHAHDNPVNLILFRIDHVEHFGKMNTNSHM